MEHLTINLKKAILPVLSCLLAASCYYDKEGILYPETANCNAQDSSFYASDVKPILDGRCNNCHGGSSPSAGIRLDAYNQIILHVTNGSLLGSIKHTGSFSPMPKNSGKLSFCEIQKIENWIKAGALNN